LGGAIFIGDQSMKIKESIFEENIARIKGGAVSSLAQSKILNPFDLILYKGQIQFH